MSQIVLIAHNIRSTHNIGSLFRTAEGFGVTRIILSGYSPYPAFPGDPRLPHIAEKLTRQIKKTALGAEVMVPFTHYDTPPIDELRKQGYQIVALEQDDSSTPLPDYTPAGPIALVLGEEVSGISPELLAQCDTIVEIPMSGTKESFNVSVAAGIALYHCTTAR